MVDCVQDSLRRFATGTYMIWYPLLQRPEPAIMVGKLMDLSVNWLQIEMTVQAPSDDGYGMHGSGMFIINPPYTLPDLLDETMPVLTKILEKDDSANSFLASNIR